jgi:S-adenosylmethionine:tRNA ribosyltransferase-isomerase
MDVSDFSFELPEQLIAQEAAPRGTSRLLVLDRSTGALQHSSIAALPSFLSPGDLLVVNNTRVFAARLLGRRVPSGGAVECFLLGPADPAAAASTPGTPGTLGTPGTPGTFGTPGTPGTLGTLGTPGTPGTPGTFSALMHPGQKLKPGALVRFEGPAGVLMGEVIGRHFHGRRTIRLWSEKEESVDALVDALGHMPLPPYIKRADTPADRERYQTVFAKTRGSVAAPTAGLHFTPALLSEIEAKGVERAEITLHVGYGTFKPVRVQRVEDHVVDPEAYDIPARAAERIARAKAGGRRVIAVGTTTTRALEDAALRGGGHVLPGPGLATLFLYPGHRFQIVDTLLTNFHLPESSLLMLVAAFAGRERVLDAYREAVRHEYRFYSYGDAMLIV